MVHLGHPPRQPRLLRRRGDERGLRRRLLRPAVLEHPLEEGPRLLGGRRRRRQLRPPRPVPALDGHEERLDRRRRSTRSTRRSTTCSKTPATADELTRAKDAILNSFVFRFDSKQKVMAREDALRVLRLPARLPGALPRRHREGDGRRRGPRGPQPTSTRTSSRCWSSARPQDFDRPLAGFGPVATLDITIPEGTAGSEDGHGLDARGARAARACRRGDGRRREAQGREGGPAEGQHEDEDAAGRDEHRRREPAGVPRQAAPDAAHADGRDDERGLAPGLVRQHADGHARDAGLAAGQRAQGAAHESRWRSPSAPPTPR